MLRFARLIGLTYLGLCLLTLASTAFGGPRFYAPLRLPIGPEPEPVVLAVAYGSEKQEWLEEAARRYAATNPNVAGRPVQIMLEPVGSREIATSIADGSRQPVVVSPASTIQLELLKGEFAARNNGAAILAESGEAAPEALVLTPLVLVAWSQRADVLWPNGVDTTWQDLHDALVDPAGWQALGHPEWGFVKFGHTSPETSNSGMQTLLLMLSAFHDKTSGLSSADVLDPAFQQWFLGIENGATRPFDDSTGFFMTQMIQFGPSKYDIAAVYENLAIANIERAQGRWGDTLRVRYPPTTVWSDHPYAILQAPWVTPEQTRAAIDFKQFLLSPEIQQLALQYGFRPGNPDVAVVTNDPNNPFNKYARYGIEVQPAQLNRVVEVPPADVLNTLLDLWRRQVNS